LKEKVAKRIKTLQVYRFVCANKRARLSPLVMFARSFANIRRNREARECFAALLWSANAREARSAFSYWHTPFCRERKTAHDENAPWFRAIFAPNTFSLKEKKFYIPP